MSIANLILAIFLIVFGISLLGWVAVSSVFLGALAFAAGVLLVLGGFAVYDYKINGR